MITFNPMVTNQNHSLFPVESNTKTQSIVSLHRNNSPSLKNPLNFGKLSILVLNKSNQQALHVDYCHIKF